MYPLNFKIILAGDEAVGKTSLVRRYVSEKFNESYLPTLGFEISVKLTQIDGRPVIFSIWDIGGQQCFEPMRRRYYQGSAGFLLVFNLSNAITFKNMASWIIDIRETCPNASIVLVANKVDLTPWKVSREEIDMECSKLRASRAVFTSAKTGDGVAEAFIALGDAIIKNDGFKQPKCVENESVV